jgi:hypothetical protein
VAALVGAAKEEYMITKYPKLLALTASERGKVMQKFSQDGDDSDVLEWMLV